MGLFDGTPLARPVTCERCGRPFAKAPAESRGPGAPASSGKASAPAGQDSARAGKDSARAGKDSARAGNAVSAGANDICTCPRGTDGKVSLPKDQQARVRREKRRGNWNTIVSGLSEGDAKSVLKTLKAKLGAGGAVDDRGELVLQGDHKDAVLAHLLGLGYAAKGAGG